MHPDYVETGPRGAGWYLVLEDGTVLEGGPYPSEEAAWAEVARRESAGTPSRSAPVGQARL